MPKRLAGLLAVAVFSLSCVHAQTEKGHTDRIFVNGKIWTADDAQPLARALAISGDRTVAVGSDEEVRAMAAPDTAVLDLRGHLVVPGFQDSHLHFPGRSVNEVDLHGVETLEDFQQRLSDFAKRIPCCPGLPGMDGATRLSQTKPSTNDTSTR